LLLFSEVVLVVTGGYWWFGGWWRWWWPRPRLPLRCNVINCFPTCVQITKGQSTVPAAKWVSCSLDECMYAQWWCCGVRAVQVVQVVPQVVADARIGSRRMQVELSVGEYLSYENEAGGEG